MIGCAPRRGTQATCHGAAPRDHPITHPRCPARRLLAPKLVWEHFAHDADVGIRGRGETRDQAFAEAALALTAVVTDPGSVAPQLAGGDPLRGARRRAPARRLAERARLRDGDAPHAVRALRRDDRRGPRADGHAPGASRSTSRRHQPAVEVKGATMTALARRARARRHLARPDAWSTSDASATMDPHGSSSVDATTWEHPAGRARCACRRCSTPSEALVRDMDDKVREQACNVAMLPGIVGAVLRDARRPLGLRLPDRRRRGLRSRRGRRGLGRRRRLRHLVRRALPR